MIADDARVDIAAAVGVHPRADYRDVLSAPSGLPPSAQELIILSSLVSRCDHRCYSHLGSAPRGGLDRMDVRTAPRL
ncbi:MAG: hypothetical protein ABI083_04800, partial [Lapillicoccus sp.]